MASLGLNELTDKHTLYLAPRAEQCSTSCDYFQTKIDRDIDGLVQERRNSSALAMEFRLSCINLSI